MARVCLILVPSQAALYDRRSARCSPLPLVLGVLQGYLRREGHDVVATDLNTAMSRADAGAFEDGWALLYDKARVLRYLAGAGDADLDEWLDAMLCETAAADSDIVGISTGPDMAFLEIHLALLLGRRARTGLGKPAVLGGLNLGFLWDFRQSFGDLWNAIGDSCLLVGPGERSFARLIGGGAPFDRGLFSTLPGAIHRDGSALVRNGYDAPTFVTPDFHGLPLDRYRVWCDATPPREDSERRNLVHYYQWPASRTVQVSEANRALPASCRVARLVIPYVSNYSCPHRCAFCIQSRRDKPPAANAGAPSVVDDLERLSREYDTTYFRFYDNAFNYSPAFVDRFCRLVEERRLSIHWSDCARFDNLEQDGVERLSRAGCRKLIFGLDTASEKISRLIDKGIDLKRARRVLDWCRQAGIWAEIEVIVGMPFENEPEFMDTYRFVSEEIEKGTLNDFHLNRYVLLPPSLLGREPQRYGIAVERVPDGYDRLLNRERDRVAGVLAAQKPGGPLPAPAMRRQLLWTYREIGGRSADRIESETEDKFSRMMALKRSLPTSSPPGPFTARPAEGPRGG